MWYLIVSIPDLCTLVTLNDCKNRKIQIICKCRYLYIFICLKRDYIETNSYLHLIVSFIFLTTGFRENIREELFREATHTVSNGYLPQLAIEGQISLEYNMFRDIYIVEWLCEFTSGLSSLENQLRFPFILMTVRYFIFILIMHV